MGVAKSFSAAGTWRLGMGELGLVMVPGGRFARRDHLGDIATAERDPLLRRPDRLASASIGSIGR
jgi:hypothetical protein